MKTTSYHKQSNSAGDSVVSPTSVHHTERIAVAGGASTRNVVVDWAPFDPGAQVKLLLTFPDLTAGIVVKVYSGDQSGSPVFSFTTDAEQPNALFTLTNDGTGGYDPTSQEIPAFISE